MFFWQSFFGNYFEKVKANENFKILLRKKFAKKDVEKLRIFFWKANTDKALGILIDLEKKYQKNYLPSLLLGKFYHKQEKRSKAYRAFEKAFRLAPNDLIVLYEKSCFHYDIGEYKKAFDLIEKYLSKKTDSKGYRRRAFIWQKLGKKRKSRPGYLKGQ